MTRLYDLCCLGNALVDVLAEVGDDLLADLGLVKGSMELCDSVRSDEIYARLPAGIEQSGGSAANTVAGFAELGGSCSFMGCIGDDSFGKVFEHDLASLGVNFFPSYRIDLPTGHCLVLVTADAERSMATHLGASGLFGEDSVDEEVIKSSGIVYLEGYLFDSDSNKAAFDKAARVASVNDVRVALTLSDGFCVDRHRADFLQFIEGSVDILFANEQELLSLSGCSDYTGALADVGRLAPLSFMTRGEHGVVICESAGLTPVEAIVPERTLDTTGAGDQFAAGVLYGISQGRSLSQSAGLGVHLASKVIGQFGARLPKSDKGLFPLSW